MKHAMFIVICLAALVAMPLMAQTYPSLTGEIPFAFYVGNQQMPAGQYDVTTDIRVPRLIRVTSADCKYTSLLFTNAAIATASDKARLVFNKYPGERYFLAEAWYPGTGNGLAMVKSHTEREQVSSMLMSGLRPERVVVLMIQSR